MPPNLFNPHPFQRGSSLGWAVLDAGKPVNIVHYPDHPYAMNYGIEAGLKAFLGVPVSAGERTLGVLKLFCLESNKSFTARDEELALAIGQQAGIYIQNARLFAQTQQRAQQLSTLNEVGQAVATLVTCLHCNCSRTGKS
jgi:GAF domain-containing protein